MAKKFLNLIEQITSKINSGLQTGGLVKLASDYKLIESIEDLEDDTLYVEMFPDSSNERSELLKEVNKQKNSFVLKMWETS